jgi:hypothetical protein
MVVSNREFPFTRADSISFQGKYRWDASYSVCYSTARLGKGTGAVRA